MTEVQEREVQTLAADAQPADGQTLEAIGDPKTVESIIEALRTVHDPEIPVNIYDLGLIYRIEVKEHEIVQIDMTLTAPGCPVAGEMVSMVQVAVLGASGVSLVTVNLVFDPPWDQSKMSEAAKLELGFF